MTTTDVEPSEQKTRSTLRWLALAVLVMAAFMTTLDDFIVFVAEPAIQRDLHMDAAALQWVIAAYVLAYGVLVITGGRLGDIFGRRRMFVLGLLGFALTSLLCGLAPTTWILVAARALEGIAAAIMFPQVFSLIKVTFADDEQRLAVGIVGAVIGAAAIGGQLVGGLLLDANFWGLSWRPIFFINVPVGILAALIAQLLLSESRSATATRVDLPGVILATTTLLLLTFPLVQGREMGWPFWTFLCLIAVIPAAWLFVRYEQQRTARVGSPLLELSLFHNTILTRCILVLLLETAIGSGLFFVLALFLQTGHRFTAFEAGIAFTPMAITYTIGSLATSRLAPILGKRILHTGIIIASFGVLATIVVILSSGTHISILTMLPLAIMGFGNALIATPLPGFIIEEVEEDAVGAASGAISTAQQVGPTLGVAVIGVVFFNALGTHPTSTGYTTAFISTLLYYTLTICLLQMLLVLGIGKRSLSPVKIKKEEVIHE